MSEAEPQANSPSSTATPDPQKREEATRVVSEILQRMDIPAELDVKDGADGGISIALNLVGEAAGGPPGRRSHVTDALQFLTNKIVNRPGAEKRWVSLGIGGHPEPRPKMERPKKAPPPARHPPRASPPAIRNGAPSTATPQSRVEVDESSLEVAEDAALASAVKQLAQKSGTLGRFYAIVGMSAEDRARTLRAAKECAGVGAKAEGEGRSRRVVFTPDKPAPLPKKTGHVYDDEDDRPQ